MENFNLERLGVAASVLGITKCLYEETRKYSVERQAFGHSLRGHQVIRHKIVDMNISIQAMETMLDNAIWRAQQGGYSAAETAILKPFVGIEHEKCASNAVQIHRGAGVLRGNKVEEIFRESKILSIGGGSTEVIKDLVAKQTGI